MVDGKNPESKAAQVISVGYPGVEALIESEQFDAVNETFEKAYAQLEEMCRKRGGFGRSRNARKAMRAIETVMDLLRELLSIKYRLQEMANPDNTNTTKGDRS